MVHFIVKLKKIELENKKCDLNANTEHLISAA